MAKIVGIKFRNTAKVYYFDPANNLYKKGEGVIVETARGVEYGTIVIENRDVPDEELVQPLKPIIRKANAKDEERLIRNSEKEPEALRICQEKVNARSLNMKLIGAEYTFDGSKVVFYFTAPSRIDFRELVKDLAQVFKIRIELRQIGIRDETRLLGGIAPCGRVCCCANCMSDFKKVSIKMAKTQGLSLNPSKISGLCGRLMCCLAYENDFYKDIYKKMPKVGSEVITPDGKGAVLSINMITNNIKVKITDRDGSLSFKDYKLEEIKVQKANSEDEKLSKEEMEAARQLQDD